MNVIACIPVHGRIPLFIHTVNRLLNRNGVSRVICVGSNDDDRAVCRLLGDRVEWVQHANSPLGAKWNAAFIAAAAHDPDAILFVGSSDWVTDNWVALCMHHLQQHDMVGRSDYMMLDIDNRLGLRMCHWHGYTQAERKQEPIGIGRMLGRKILEKMNYRPFETGLEYSMDHSMHQKVLKLGGTVGLMTEPDMISLSISTDRWTNKHIFNDHYDQKLPSDIIARPYPILNQHFHEAFQIFQ